MDIQDKGVDLKEFQYRICTGTLGGKQWSNSERKEACDKYEELTGKKVDPQISESSPLPVISSLLGAALIIAVTVYLLIKKRSSNKNNARKLKNK